MSMLSFFLSSSSDNNNRSASFTSQHMDVVMDDDADNSRLMRSGSGDEPLRPRSAASITPAAATPPPPRDDRIRIDFGGVDDGDDRLAEKLAGVVHHCRLTTLARSLSESIRRKATAENETRPENGSALKNRSSRNATGDGFRRAVKVLTRARRWLLLLLTPIALLPLLLSDDMENKCAFCVLLMAVYWASEVLPLAVTALLPLVLFPTIGLIPSHQIAVEYVNNTSILFMGGLIMAIAVEKSRLHERLALRVLVVAGSAPKWIMLGFMVVTASLSMFISNTATTAMILPIGESVVRRLLRNNNNGDDDGRRVVGAGSCSTTTVSPARSKCSSTAADVADGKRWERVAKALMLSICLAANIGGVGTLTGTGPNLVFVGMIETLLPAADSADVHFLSWMAFGVPLVVICVSASWLILYLLFMRGSEAAPSSTATKRPNGRSSSFADNEDEALNFAVRKQFEQLEPMSFAQRSVCGCFVLLLALWMCRDPKVVPGVARLFRDGFYTDATSATIVSILLFVLPDRLPCLCRRRRWRRTRATTQRFSSDVAHEERTGRLMDWPTMQERFPWGVVLLLGGGFALAAGVKRSGLSARLADWLSATGAARSAWKLQLLCVLTTMVVTNVCSNTVTATVFIPIVAAMAERASLHPLSLMLPTAIACSFAFVLPVGTPPNAIAFSSSLRVLRTRDMILSGVLISLALTALLVGYMTVYAPLIFPRIVLARGGASLDADQRLLIHPLNSSTILL